MTADYVASLARTVTAGQLLLVDRDCLQPDEYDRVRVKVSDVELARLAVSLGHVEIIYTG